MLACRFSILLFWFIFASPAGLGQNYGSSVVGTDFDIITDGDPSCFEALAFQRLEDRAEMPDKTGKDLFKPAYVFRSSYSDKTRLDVFVDARFGSEELASNEAMRYVGRLGKLPTALRGGVERLVIHKSDEETTAFSDRGLMVLYSANATKRISDNDLEETLFHESVHASWDAKHAKSKVWTRAQLADGTFATVYARRKPSLEDLAESALFAFAAIHHPDRLPVGDLEAIKRSIPNRIMYIEELLPAGKPLIYEVSPADFCRVDLSRTGMASDIIQNVLDKHYEMTESEINDCLENLGDELILAVARKLDIDEKEFRKKVEEMRHVNCDHTKE